MCDLLKKMLTRASNRFKIT